MPATSDLVHQTTTTTGTGALTLTAADGKRTFLAAFGTGGTNTFDYFISHRSAAEWEVGTGHENAGTLVRDTVVTSSNANAAVNFSAGTKDVTNDEPAAGQGYRGHRLGTATNDNAAAGEVGEYVESEILVGSAVSVTNVTQTDITSISLTAGDWDVSGSVYMNPAAGTTTTVAVGWVSSTSATLPTAPNKGGQFSFNVSFLIGTGQVIPLGKRRFSLSGTTTVYLSVYLQFSGGTNSAAGVITARRMR